MTKDKLISLVEQEEYLTLHDLSRKMLIERIEQMFYEWLASITDEEREIRDRALDFQEEYFTDMQLLDYSEELASYVKDETGELIISNLTKATAYR